jgi:hypothetical protein
MAAEHGELESAAVAAGEKVTARALLAALRAMPEGTRKVQVKPRKNPADRFVFGSVFQAPVGWFVFGYVQPPR